MGLGDSQVSRVNIVVLSEACTEPQFVSDEAHGPAGRAVKQLSGGGPDSSAEVSDQDSISLYSYSPKELARKQRHESAFCWLVGSLQSGIVPQDSELILSRPEKKCYFLERGQIKMNKEGVILRVSSPDPDRLLVRVAYGRR